MTCTTATTPGAFLRSGKSRCAQRYAPHIRSRPVRGVDSAQFRMSAPYSARAASRSSGSLLQFPLTQHPGSLAIQRALHWSHPSSRRDSVDWRSIGINRVRISSASACSSIPYRGAVVAPVRVQFGGDADTSGSRSFLQVAPTAVLADVVNIDAGVPGIPIRAQIAQP